MRSAVNWETVRSATKRFGADFPNFKNIRHAVAHAADLSKSPQESERTRIKGPYAGPLVHLSAGTSATISNSLINETYATTIGGRLVSYDVTAETGDKLESIMLQFYSAFKTT